MAGLTRGRALVPFPLLLLGPVAVVVTGVPVWVHLHVLLTFQSGLLVILGLLVTTQAVPLNNNDVTNT